MVNRAKFAAYVTNLLGGKNRSGLISAACVALSLVILSGAALASCVADLRMRLMNSRIVATLTAPSERGALSYIITNPEEIVLLLRYINSLAGAVTNMEASPKWRVSQFNALLDAAEESEVEILDFFCDEQGEELSVIGTKSQNADAFIEAIMKSGCFSNVSSWQSLESDRSKFLIICTVL